MSFQQALSGLNVASKAIEATSHNIANSSTVGFKASQAHFADILAASLTGGTSTQIGIGATLSSVAQQFTQGNITTTNNPLDLAINGQGFYRLNDNGATTYSRNGQFHIDKSGFIVNDQGLQLTGYLGNAQGIIVPTTAAPIQISTTNLAPATTTGVTAGLNLDSRSPVLPAVPAFDPTKPTTYTSSTALNVFDSLGNAHTYTMFFRKTGAGAWDFYSSLDSGAASGPTAVNFDTAGAMTAPVGAISESFTLTNGATTPLDFTLAFPGTTQFGNTFSVNQLSQDGYTAGGLAGLSVGQDGTIQGRYTNGQTRDLAQLVLANFTNPNGLAQIGDNQWTETVDSGQPLVGTPTTGLLGVIQSAAVEESNVDLTAELVNLITQQRNYQASAQSVKTVDQILSTLVNLR